QIQPSGSYLPSHITPSTTYGTSNINIGSIVDGYTGGLTNGFVHGHGHQDQRSVYFFAAPEDESAARFRVYVQPSSRRNTKIIFVKAPSYGGVIPEVIAPPSQAEEKTKIYVLVRKPQNGGSITIPSSLGVRQGKPEVFFIKYRNHNEAAAAVSQGLHGGSVGAHLEDLGNEQNFVRTLATHHGGIGTIGTGITSIADGAIGGGVYGTPAITGTKPVYGPPSGSGPYKK
ncbi:hypothetical protein ILUMI_09676, partial [Ignelater luminosus]